MRTEKRWIIQDWAGNKMSPLVMAIYYKQAVTNIYPGNNNGEFNSFEDAEDFLCTILDEKYEEDRQEYEVVISKEVEIA